MNDANSAEVAFQAANAPTTNLEELAHDLEALAAECLTLGTSFNVRRHLKSALAVIPIIERARDKQW